MDQNSPIDIFPGDDGDEAQIVEPIPVQPINQRLEQEEGVRCELVGNEEYNLSAEVAIGAIESEE